MLSWFRQLSQLVWHSSRVGIISIMAKTEAEVLKRPLESDEEERKVVTKQAKVSVLQFVSVTRSNVSWPLDCSKETISHQRLRNTLGCVHVLH